jgi:hypothetical protein
MIRDIGGIVAYAAIDKWTAAEILHDAGTAIITIILKA